MRNRLVGLCALFALCGTAQATTVWTGTNFRVDASDPVPVGINLEAVTLTVVGLNGALPQGFSIDDGALSGITSDGNNLHQIWIANVVPTPTEQFLDGLTTPIDSHFIGDDSTLFPVPAEPPVENRPVMGSVEHANGGFGSYLRGSFALLTAPTSTWDIAYLAVPTGTKITLQFTIADGAEIGTKPNEVVSTTLVVPEPATVSLLATGALALVLCFVVRRRSR